MWPAGIEPAAPRVSDERSTGELRPRDGRGWTRTSDNLFVRQALSPLSYSPVRIRDKGSNLDLHVQSVVSCRLDDPGALWHYEVFYATRLPFGPGSVTAATV